MTTYPTLYCIMCFIDVDLVNRLACNNEFEKKKTLCLRKLMWHIYIYTNKQIRLYICTASGYL